MDKSFILIGLDGGATKISGWTVNVETANLSFSLGDIHAEKIYRDYPTFQPEFTPIDIQTQLREFSDNTIHLTPDEKRQGKAYMDACANVISDISSQIGNKPVIVGIGMPGLKTKDRRGIAVLANGPRMPEYCDIVEAKLSEAGIKLAKPIAHLGSDADYCGIGEEYSTKGLFKDIEFGYYLGGGTGAADALKLNGKLVPFDHIKEWLAKTWEMKNDQNISLEQVASARGIQSIYSKYAGISVEELNENNIYPDQILKKAMIGEKAAIRTCDDVSRDLALLIYERITTLYSGWQGIFDFVNPNRQDLSKEHSYLETLLDRIIIGQRLGNLLQTSKNSDFLWYPFINQLGKLIIESDCLDLSAKSHYLKGRRFDTNLIKISKLREAPALGAGIDAYLFWRNEGQNDYFTYR